MDHDNHEIRIRRMESFLDAHADGWRDKETWKSRRQDSKSGGDELEVDEDKTNQDRELLGFTDQSRIRNGQVVHAPQAVAGERPGIDDGKDAELRKNFRAGKGAVSDEQAQQDERAEILSQLEPFRGKTNVPELTGEESNDGLRTILLQAQKDNPEIFSTNADVTLSGEAGEKAMQTANDPSRQARGAAQVDQKRALEAGADIRPQQ